MRAVPKSGCFSTISMGMPTMAPAFRKIGPGKLALPQIGKILGHGQNENEFHPLRRLEMVSTGHLDPAPRAQIFLAENQDRHQ